MDGIDRLKSLFTRTEEKSHVYTKEGKKVAEDLEQAIESMRTELEHLESEKEEALDLVSRYEKISEESGKAKAKAQKKPNEKNIEEWQEVKEKAENARDEAEDLAEKLHSDDNRLKKVEEIRQEAEEHMDKLTRAVESTARNLNAASIMPTGQE